MTDPKEERWIWIGFAKESRLLLRIVVGPRMQESVDELIKGIDSCLNKNNEFPLFISDGDNQYRMALFSLYNETVTPPNFDVFSFQNVSKLAGQHLVNRGGQFSMGKRDQF